MEKMIIGVPEYILQLSHGKPERAFKDVEIAIPEYSQKDGLWPILEEDYTISAYVDTEGNIVIKADRGGLISLARHLLTLAQENVLPWVHIHYDDWNNLEKRSKQLIIEKS